MSDFGEDIMEIGMNKTEINVYFTRLSPEMQEELI